MVRKLPWTFYKVGNRLIVDANEDTFMCNEQYYPWIDLPDEDWQEMVDAVNSVERFKGALEDILSADESSTLEGAVAIARRALGR